MYFSKNNTKSLCLILLLSVSQFSFASDWVYSVRAGDTLWEVCKKHTSVTNCWQRLGPYNNLVLPKTLTPGTRLKIPVSWLKLQPAPAKIVYLMGSVSVTSPKGLTENAQIDSLVHMGSQLNVSAKSSATVKFADNSQMTIDELSLVRFDRLSSHESTGMVDSQIHLSQGSVRTKVPKQTPNSVFHISTPSAVAAVRGTEFSVKSARSQDHSTQSATYEGEVMVGNSIEAKSVPSGFGIITKQDQALPDLVKLLPAPKVTPRSLTKSVTLPYQVNWQEIDKSTHYNIEIFLDQEMSRAVRKVTSEKSYYSINNLEDACYWVRLSATDELGFEGIPSVLKLCSTTPNKNRGLIAFIVSAITMALIF